MIRSSFSFLSSRMRIAAFASVTALAAAAFAANETIADWNIAGPFGGTATSIAVDPSHANVVLAGALNSLLYKSSDAGANWSLMDFPKRHLSELTSILVDPADPQHYLVGVIAADGGGLYESHDAGAKWSPVAGMSSFGVRAISYAPSQPTRFAAGTANGVMLSDDAGKTWNRGSDEANLEMRGITVVTFDPKDANILYAGTSHLPWKTMDGGKTWTSIHNGMIDDSDVFSIYVNPLNPSTIYASACSGIYSSGDRGDLWKKLMGIPNTSRRTHVIRQDPANASVIYAGTTTGLYKSVNSGATWKTLTNTQANAMAFDPSNPQVLYTALQYEGIGKSENGGERIVPVNHGFVDRVISAVTISGDKLVAIETQEGDSTGIFVSKDRGASWMQMDVVRGLSGVHLKAITGLRDEEKTLLAASPHAVYKSIDGGSTWKSVRMRLVTMPPAPLVAEKTAPAKPVGKTAAARRAAAARAARAARPIKPKPIIKDISLSDVNGLYALKIAGKHVLFAATDLGLLKSDDLGNLWSLSPIPSANAVSALHIGPGETPVLIAHSATGLYVSKNLGESWTAMSFPKPASEVNDIALPALDGAPLLAATRTGLYASPDGGEKWSAVSSGLPPSTVNSVIYGADKLAFAVQYGRLYQSRDNGSTWDEIHSALPLTRIRQLWKADAAAARIYALTGDLGVLYRD